MLYSLLLQAFATKVYVYNHAPSSWQCDFCFSLARFARFCSLFYTEITFKFASRFLSSVWSTTHKKGQNNILC